MKLLKSIIAVILLISTLFSLTACSLFYNPLKNDGNDSGIGKKKTNITVYNGGSATQFEVEYGKEAQITPHSKKGYYLLGYYTEAKGGEKYFDSNGKSTKAWEKDMPSTFYAQWASISNLTYKSEVNCTEKAKTLGFYSTSFSYKLSEDFVNAINSNLNEELNITVHFKAKEKLSGVLSSYAPVTVRLQDGSSDSASVYGSQTVSPPSEYKSYDLDFSVDAESFKKGTVCVVFDLGYTYTSLYLMDISITASFD